VSTHNGLESHGRLLLYEKSENRHQLCGRWQTFGGADRNMFDVDPDATGDKRVYLQQCDKPRNPARDPYHDMTDTLRQLFFENLNGYADDKDSDMGGFVWSSGVHDEMMTFKAEQQSVLNGLVKNCAVSDKWFCSMPGATDANRAFALTSSALLGQLNNFMNGPQYTDWDDAPLRSSIWKVLWANGWKSSNSIGWIGFPLTYQLFLKGQLPAVDAKDQVKNHIADFDRFPTGLGGSRRPVAASVTRSAGANNPN
jgi:hypothetical protein